MVNSYFEGKRGLRLGDPLSPLIFTLCMKYLTRILGVVCQREDFKYHSSCGPLKFTHLMFADDLILFCKGNLSSILTLLRGFATFSAASGLTMNSTKSEIYFNGVKEEVISEVEGESGFRRGNLPFRYLGVPISHKRLTKQDCKCLIEKMVSKIRN